MKLWIGITAALVVLLAAAVMFHFWRSPTVAVNPDGTECSPTSENSAATCSAPNSAEPALPSASPVSTPSTTNGLEVPQTPAPPEAAIPSNSTPVQNAQCLSPYFEGVRPDARALTLTDLAGTAPGKSAIPSVANLSRTVEVNGAKLLLVVTPNSEQTPSKAEAPAEGIDPRKPGRWTLQTYKLPNPERPVLESTQTLESVNQLDTLFPNARVVLEEVTYQNFGKNRAIVRTRNGLVEEIGFQGTNATRCEVHAAANTNAVLPLICQCGG